eukprot:CAMPEP_0119049716 /NCGR_PEP_ID=MMETSP1177-20130426/66007_1 /TAXON_ID=2985 /ORGANISM="Ochromonas sp, Strain CCMP1899" /LENGTH=62 /DNA_ID=CAMNT_0007027263 /DNA_START=412 /DNA_END=597 /DNA_ORIENTATION=+
MISRSLTARTDITSSTLNVSAAGTSSSLVDDAMMKPTDPYFKYLCTFMPLVDFKPGRFTGLW